MFKSSVSILIPYYNESETLKCYPQNLFPVICDIMKDFEYDYEYIFYNDGSIDSSKIVIDEYQKFMKYNINSCGGSNNQGLGIALRDGIFLCNKEYIIVMDADLSYEPAAVRDLLTFLKFHPDADCISSSPYRRKGLVMNSASFMRYWGSVYFNKMYALALGCNDITCATSMFRLYKTSCIKKMSFKSIGFDINAEILSDFILSGKKVIEIPAVLYSRKYGSSKMKVWKEVYHALEMITKIYIKRQFPNITRRFK